MIKTLIASLTLLISVWIWTVNTKASLNRVLNFDAPFYALVTNDLVWAQEQIEEST